MKDDSVLWKMIMIVINVHERDVHATNNDDEGWIVVYVEILGNDYIESNIDVKSNDDNVDKSTIDHCKCLKEIDVYPNGCTGLLDVKVVTIHVWACMTKELVNCVSILIKDNNFISHMVHDFVRTM